MGFIVFIAVGLAALTAATAAWVQVIVLIVHIFLGMATIGTFLSAGRKRAFWVGTAMFGWQFLAVQSHPGLFSFHTTVPPLASRLATDLAAAVHPYTTSANLPDSNKSIRWYYDPVQNAYKFDAGGKIARAEAIALGLSNLAYAAIGGIIGVYLWEKGRSRSNS
jgi:hypothetical protein